MFQPSFFSKTSGFPRFSRKIRIPGFRMEMEATPRVMYLRRVVLTRAKLREEVPKCALLYIVLGSPFLYQV